MSLNGDIHLRPASGYSQLMNGRQMRKCLDTKETKQVLRIRYAVRRLHSVMRIIENCSAGNGVI